MQTKYLCVLIHIWIKGKGWPLGSRLRCLLWACHFQIGTLRQVWYLIVSIPDLCTLTYFKPSSKIFLLTVPRRCLFSGSFALFISCVLSRFHACSLLPCGPLLGKGWPFGSCLWCFISVFATFPCCILGQVWYLIVTIPDFCHLPYSTIMTWIHLEKQIIN